VRAVYLLIIVVVVGQAAKAPEIIAWCWQKSVKLVSKAVICIPAYSFFKPNFAVQKIVTVFAINKN
jgi:hypothetical protein